MRFKPKQAQVVADVIKFVDGPVEVTSEDSVVKVSGKFERNPLGIPTGKGVAIIGGGGKVTPGR